MLPYSCRSCHARSVGTLGDPDHCPIKAEYRNNLSIRWILHSRKIPNKPKHYKTNKVASVPIKDSDQNGHPPILIRAFAVGMEVDWALSYHSIIQHFSYHLVTQQWLIRLGRCPGWPESSHGAHATSLVLSFCRIGAQISKPDLSDSSTFLKDRFLFF